MNTCLIIILACVALSVTKDSSESSSSESSSGASEERDCYPLCPVSLAITKQGIVKGTTQVTLERKRIHSFVGMRYAEAPVGELRFKPPVPVKEWTGEYDASKVRPACPQPANFPTHEDCLFINVHTPKLPKKNSKKKHLYPVIIYIHGGCLTTLSGNSNYLGPHYLLDRATVSNKTGLDIYNKGMYEMFPEVFYYDGSLPNAHNITDELRKFYFNDEPVNENSLESLGELYSDAWAGFGINRGAKLLSQHLQNNVYYYMFTHQGRYSCFTRPEGSKKYVSHFDDQMYLFWNSLNFPKFEKDDPEAIMVKKLTTLFKNFAYTGNPTPYKSKKLDNVLWTPFTTENKEYLEIDTHLQMKKDMNPKRYAKWESLFPLPAV